MPYEKILITGAAGFIGFNLWKHLSKQGYRILACMKKPFTVALPHAYKIYIISLPNQELNEIIKHEKPDYMIHCAGGASVKESILNPQTDFFNNVIVTESVLNSLALYSSATKIIFLSSAAIYGNPAVFPINEETPPLAISPYGHHKLLCELICEKFHTFYQLPIIILRLFSVYGPFLKKQILWDLYQKSKTEDTITLYGDGNETRDFVYIEDLTKIIEKLITQEKFDGKKINVATGIETKIKDLATIALKIMNSRKFLHFTGQNKIGDPRRWSANPYQKLGITNWTPIEVGIKKYIDWLNTGCAL